MNSTSLIIVVLATVIGTVGLFFGVRASMDASDEYASKLSMSSVAYLHMREKAIAEGRDPTKIRMNAARSQKPAGYDDSLASATTSPYVTPDSDQLNSDEQGGEVTQIVIISIDADGAESTQADASSTAAIIAEDAGGEGDENSEEEEYVYTVSDEIRHQLATEEMSEEKRETLESVLPQKKPKPVRAIDVRMKFDSRACVVPRNSNSWIGIMFRQNSSAIRGTSLNELDDLIRLRERCEGTLILEDYIATNSDDVNLLETRRDEVKYYLLQSRVPKESIQVGNL